MLIPVSYTHLDVYKRQDDVTVDDKWIDVQIWSSNIEKVIQVNVVNCTAFI